MGEGPSLWASHGIPIGFSMGQGGTHNLVPWTAMLKTESLKTMPLDNSTVPKTNFHKPQGLKAVRSYG